MCSKARAGVAEHIKALGWVDALPREATFPLRCLTTSSQHLSYPAIVNCCIECFPHNKAQSQLVMGDAVDEATSDT